ncbi:MAG: MFS transporter [Patescibacteria group bacterium]
MKNKSLQALLVFNSIFVFASGLLGPLYVLFAQKIDSNIFSISVSWAVYLAATTIFMIFIRKYGDRVQEKKYLLVSGYLVRAIVWFSFPFISTFSALILLQILLGVGEALGTPAYDTIFASHLDKGKEMEEYTDRKLLVNFSDAIGITVGGFILEKFGFNILFPIMGTLALASSVGILLQPKKLV